MVVGGAAQEAHAHVGGIDVVELAVVQVIDRVSHAVAQVGEDGVGIVGLDGHLVVSVAGIQHGGVRGHVVGGPARGKLVEAITEHREATGHGVVHMQLGTFSHRGGERTFRTGEDGIAVHGRAIHHQQGTAAEGNSTCAARSITHGQAAAVHQLQFLARVVGSAVVAGLGHGLLRLFGTGAVDHQALIRHADGLVEAFGFEGFIGVESAHLHQARAGCHEGITQSNLFRHQGIVHKCGSAGGNQIGGSDGQIAGGGIDGTRLQRVRLQGQVVAFLAGVALFQRQGLAGIHHALTEKIATGSAADDDILASLYQRTVFQAQGTDQDMIAGQDIGSISVDAQMMVGRRIIEIANGFLYLQRDVTGIDNACIRVIAIDPHGDDDAGGITILA